MENKESENRESGNFPDMKHLGDITKISGFSAPPVEVIIGGSPCQEPVSRWKTCGGFRTNEIEKLPISVTKKHFGGQMTNEEKINRMTQKEKAAFLDNIYTRGHFRLDPPWGRHCQRCTDPIRPCGQCTLDWLGKEAEE